MAILYNDTLPGQPIDVPDESVPTYERSGWHRQRPGVPAEPEPEPELVATHPDGEEPEELTAE